MTFTLSYALSRVVRQSISKTTVSVRLNTQIMYNAGLGSVPVSGFSLSIATLLFHCYVLTMAGYFSLIFLCAFHRFLLLLAESFIGYKISAVYTLGCLTSLLSNNTRLCPYALAILDLLHPRQVSSHWCRTVTVVIFPYPAISVSMDMGHSSGQ